MQKVVLNNGVEMPVLGFGVFQINDANECERCVCDAIEAGYRLIDTAASYGNEEAVGKAIKRSGVPREELFITTKLWVSDTGYENTKRAFEKSLKNLQFDYLDLYLIHQPLAMYMVHARYGGAIPRGKSQGNWSKQLYPDRLVDLVLHNEIAPAVNQVETHPFCQQIDSQKVMEEYKVQIESWGPFAEGRNNMFQNEVLVSLAQKHNKSVAQIVLRWLVQRGVVAIPKSVRKERIIENFSIFDFELSSEDMDKIAALDKKESAFFSHRDPEMVKWICSLKR